ncbi:AsmA family protein [Vibrio tapetis]|uniref:Putative AsmA protein n=1 Tax=Vibrio tapetis subsp. tapetis TaxID=1671868 RepID=A0A2N8ZGP6_9VIBR|nr:AsmA family protein [Vibrio tapetis]SON51089.1 putative AsmA protein [Vibrio tapetis subsp. tapetis]
MRKALALIILMFSLMLISILILFASLHTRYATPVVNFIFKYASSQTIRADLIEYQSPYHFTFHGLELSTSPEPLYIETAQLWLNQGLVSQGKLAIDSLLLSGFQLQQGMPEITPSPYVSIAQVAVDHLDYSDDALIIRDLSFQIKQPEYQPSSSWPVRGEIQLSAEQLYWNNEAFDNVLVDADVLEDGAKIYGLSFKWRQADIKTQAEWLNNQWHLINASIKGLQLSHSQWMEVNSNQIFEQLSTPVFIERLDVLSTTITSDVFSLTAADITLDNIQYPVKVWQQDGRVSLNAENITLGNQTLLEPTLSLQLTENKIAIDDLNVGFKRGYIQLQGSLDPNAISLNNLTVSGVEWLIENEADQRNSFESDLTGLNLKSLIPELNNYHHPEFVAIKRLRIKRSQFINLASEPKRQVSGLNISGDDLLLVKDSQLGLWSGNLTLSANSASIGELIASQSLIEAHAEDGISYLDKLVVPLQHGLMRAQGKMDFTQLSQPWQLKFQSDGFPLQTLGYWRTIPLGMKGLAEVEFDLNGLAGDEAMLNYSLSGFANVSLRDASIEPAFEQIMNPKPDQPVLTSPITVGDFSLKMKRGDIELTSTKIQGKDFTGQLKGSLDLVANDIGKLTLSLASRCGQLRVDLLTKQQEINNAECKTGAVQTEKVIIPFE